MTRLPRSETNTSRTTQEKNARYTPDRPPTSSPSLTRAAERSTKEVGSSNYSGICGTRIPGREASMGVSSRNCTSVSVRVGGTASRRTSWNCLGEEQIKTTKKNGTTLRYHRSLSSSALDIPQTTLARLPRPASAAQSQMRQRCAFTIRHGYFWGRDLQGGTDRRKRMSQTLVIVVVPSAKLVSTCLWIWPLCPAHVCLVRMLFSTNSCDRSRADSTLVANARGPTELANLLVEPV